MVYDLVIKDGWIVTHQETVKGTLVIHKEKVVSILSEEETVEGKYTINASGKYILPGLIDAHVHAGHGEPERESFGCVTRSAAAGGITTILEQPLSNPSTTNEKAYLAKKAAAKAECHVDFGLWGGLVPGNESDLETLHQLGGEAYKAFMCRCSNYPMSSDHVLYRGMQKIASLGGLLAVHAENDTMIYDYVDELKAIGKNDIEAYLKSHQPYTELEAIERFVFLMKLVPDIKGHIVHMSIPQGAEVIKLAKMQGIDITAETCPQYLALNENDLHEIGGVAKCDPPVRSHDLVEKLWEFVLDGTIDIIASDHSPHPYEKKLGHREEFDRISEGVTSIQTLLPVMLTEGVHGRGLSLNRLVSLTSYNVAKRFGLLPYKGQLTPGSDGDFIILDLNKEWVCKAEDMFYLNQHTPYDGRVFKGQVEATYVRGHRVYNPHEVLSDAGFGRYYPMRMTNYK